MSTLSKLRARLTPGTEFLITDHTMTPDLADNARLWTVNQLAGDVLYSQDDAEGLETCTLPLYLPRKSRDVQWNTPDVVTIAFHQGGVRLEAHTVTLQLDPPNWLTSASTPAEPPHAERHPDEHTSFEPRRTT